jgi:putative transposase
MQDAGPLIGETIMLKAYKVRLKTNNKLNSQFMRCAGVERFVYNWGLAESKRRYDEGNKIGILKLCVEFNAIKREQFPFVTEVPYAITESAFRNLDAAYKNFFRRLKKGEKPGYPKFKNRFGKKVFQLRGVKVFPQHVYLPIIGPVRLWQQNYIPVDADYGIYATISQSGGNWFISILVDDGIPLPDVVSGQALGIDVGIKTLATFSDGHTVENPRPLDKASRKLARLQRELSRRQPDGKNRKKTQIKIAKLHAKISNVRTHAQHQVSNYAMSMVKLL